MTWARQLRWLMHGYWKALTVTYLILHSFQGYSFPVDTLNCLANSRTMAELLDALSHVMCPSYISISIGQQPTSFVLFTFCWIPSRSRALNNACARRMPLWALFKRMKLRRAFRSSHLEVAISSIQWPVIAKYPSLLLACQASHVMLTSPKTVGPWKNMSVGSLESKGTYVEVLFEICHCFAEHTFDLSSSSLPSWNVGSIGCSWCDVNHELECWLLKCIYRLT